MSEKTLSEVIYNIQLLHFIECSNMMCYGAKLEGWYGSRDDTRDDMENFMS